MNKPKLSMGCRVSEPKCPLCKRGVSHTPVPRSGVMTAAPQIGNVMISYMETPKCQRCKTPMVGVDRLDWKWKCSNPDCLEHDQPVEVRGIYPARGVGDESDGD